MQSTSSKSGADGNQLAPSRVSRWPLRMSSRPDCGQSRMCGEPAIGPVLAGSGVEWRELCGVDRLSCWAGSHRRILRGGLRECERNDRQPHHGTTKRTAAKRRGLPTGSVQRFVPAARRALSRHIVGVSECLGWSARQLPRDVAGPRFSLRTAAVHGTILCGISTLVDTIPAYPVAGRSFSPMLLGSSVNEV